MSEKDHKLVKYWMNTKLIEGHTEVFYSMDAVLR